MKKAGNTILIGLIFIILTMIVTVIWAGESALQSTVPQTTTIEYVEEPTTTEISAFVTETTTEPTTEPEPAYTEDDLFCMAAAIYNEAGGDDCSDETRRMVGYVILNRVKDSRFPDSIRAVLEQHSQYSPFYLTGVKFADRSTLPQEQHAVERAYRIAEKVLEAENIPIPSTVVFQAQFKQGTSIYKYQDDMYFCHAEEVK